MKYRDLIEGKKVLLLGPASYLQNKEGDLDLKEYDVVVKINKMVEKPLLSESLNNRNDILYHCLDINVSNGDMPYKIQTWVDNNVEHLRIPMPPITPHYSRNIKYFNALNKFHKIANSTVRPETYMFVKTKCNTPPNTGTVAIYDLLINNPQQIRIAGITFCKTPYSEGYKEQVFYNKKRKSQHNHDKQIRFFKNLYSANREVIKIDEELESILERYK